MTLVSIILTYLDGDGRAMTYSEQVPLICALDGNRKTRNDETRSFRESQIRHINFTLFHHDQQQPFTFGKAQTYSRRSGDHAAISVSTWMKGPLGVNTIFEHVNEGATV